MDLKSTLYQKLSEQDKQNIKELTNKYKTSDYTLAEIFNVKSEIYKNIPLSQLCLSARVVSAIIRFKNIIDLEKIRINDDYAIYEKKIQGQEINETKYSLIIRKQRDELINDDIFIIESIIIQPEK